MTSKRFSSTSSSKPGYDHLSNLPEDVLHRIFSFLDIRESIQMCILSKRWRYFWTTLPFLNFNSDVFVDYLKSVREFYPRCRTFEDFINQVLIRRGSSAIHSLDVCLHEFSPTSNDNSWVRAAVERNLQQLRLQFYEPDFDSLELPLSLFNCKSLTSLNLGLNKDSRGVVVQLPDSIQLPCLRDLRLKSVSMLNTVFLDKFFLGCPVLERLEISCCYFDESKNLIISSDNLKHLEIDKCMVSNNRYNCAISRVMISTPSLTSYRCMDWIFNAYYLENLSSLETAYLDMSGTYKRRYKDAQEECAKSLIKCLMGLYNVKSLTLQSFVLEEISEAMEILKRPPLPFDYLRYLKVITMVDKASLEAMMYIIKNSPKIETVVIKIVWANVNSANTTDYWGEEFSLQHVKCIKVQGFTKEVEFLKILLKNALALEKMIIFTTKTSSAMLESFTKELETCPRASSHVNIRFLHDLNRCFDLVTS